jgi:hypothetical protein
MYMRYDSSKIANSSPVSEIIGDSGCSQHMFHDRKSFTDYKVQEGPRIELFNKIVIEAIGIGTARFSTPGIVVINLPNALHIPNLGKNLRLPVRVHESALKFIWMAMT